MAVLDDLLQKVSDPVLRDRLTKEIHKATKHKKFGLVFEEHLPECTLLYDVPVKIGSRVAVRDTEIKETYTVLSIEGETAKCVSNNDKEQHEFLIQNLVTVAEFGEPIYPYLQTIDTVCNAPDSDLWHILIEADNYHALQLLEYMYAGQVAVCYIDPPYNKKDSKDWKYNCNYIDGNDMYRHSKWLSMMERRLKLAKKLLNPKDSVMIIAIDELEYLHLGMLLESLFPEAKMQMISSVINPSGVARAGEFYRTDEYIYILRFGTCTPSKLPLSDEWITAKSTGKDKVRWRPIRRQGSHDTREDAPNQFYPIFLNREGTKIIGTGESLPRDKDKNSIEIPEGCIAVWPLKPDGIEGCWQISQSTLTSLLKAGYAKVSYTKKWGYVPKYLAEGERKKVETGMFPVIGYAEDGSVILEGANEEGTPFIPGTQWRISSHSARENGSSLLKKLIPGRQFPYPKSLYAVEDVLRFFVSDKPNALVVDFFAGSGTTAHALMLLNHLDGGKRCSISVTNNEVGVNEEVKFKKMGLQPGDEDWEKYGIAKYITWPRIKAAISGINTNGVLINGNYGNIEDFPMAEGLKENAIYFKLGFLDKNAVSLGTQFKELLSVLWMKAGSVGPCPHLDEKDIIPDMLILPQNRMAVLIDDTAFALFEENMKQHPEIETVYIVTDSDRGYREMLHTLGAKNTYQLYRDYLDNFRINNRR